MSLSMVNPAQRNRELIADLAPERRMLGKTEVMGVSWLPSTDQAWLLADEFEVGFVARPARLWKGECTLVDAAGFDGNPLGMRDAAKCWVRDGNPGRYWGASCVSGIIHPKLRMSLDSRPERLLKQLGICCYECIFHADGLLCPGNGLISGT